MWPKFQWNWQEFCGSDSFKIWVENHQDLSHCFQFLCLQVPILSIIAIISAYYAGSHVEWYVRRPREKRILTFRLTFVFILACIPASQIIILVYNNSKNLYVIDYGFAILASFSWFVHFCYVSSLKNEIRVSLRGHMKLISLWIMYLIACIIYTRSMVMKYQQDKSTDVLISLSVAIATVVFQILYGITLFFSEDSSSRRAPVNVYDQDDLTADPIFNQYRDMFDQYLRFREDFDQHYLGVAFEECGIISRFFFLWVNPLIENGANQKLRKPDDVYGLPYELTSTYQRDQEELQPVYEDGKYVSLVRVLHRRFAKEFYGIGILKLIADLAGFASPLLLNELLTFIDDPRKPLSSGYLYSGGIFVAAIISSFCTVHFDFLIGKMNLKLQAALTAVIYKKTLALNVESFKKISMGEIVNYVSVDMDRIANSSLCVHALWSLPVQLVVTLYLLYIQVGWASMCGVVCSLLLIPVNKYVATKIAKFSKRMMEEKDQRVNQMSEILKYIRQIKLNVWEHYFVKEILNIREKEVKYLRYRKYLDALLVYFWATTPVTISTLTFTAYIYFGGELNAAVIFTSLSLLNMLRMPLNAFPWVLNSVVEAWVSVKRLDTFLQANDIVNYGGILDNDEPETSEKHQPSDVAIVIKNGFFTSASGGLKENEESVVIKKGQLVGISGPVGSGKSNLVHGILRETHKGKKYVFVDIEEKGIGLVSQTPWIQQASVRDNILFGKPYDADRYRSVIEACALREDINLWAGGDAEVIGEAGCTLSGGQKARIALARAVYQDMSIYLLDDVLSAVDRRVANHLFQQCIVKFLAGKTRILVTHLDELFESLNWLILMEEGNIMKQGPGSSFKEINTVQAVIESPLVEVSIQENTECSNSEESQSEISEFKDNTEREVSASGVVKLSIYYKYWKSVGHGLAVFILLSVMGMQITRVAVDWWLSVWVTMKSDVEKNVTDLYYIGWFERGLIGDSISIISDYKYFLAVYMAIGLVNAIIVIMRSFSFAYGGVRAAIRIHEELLFRITEASMQFFYTSPLGRILNRFSSDTNTVDDQLPFDINILLAQIVGLIGVLITTMYGIPWVCLFVAPLIPVYHWLQNQYRMTSRELKRIFSVTRSLLYCHINETLSGLTTIRAFKNKHRFEIENGDKVDLLLKCQLSMIAAQSWLNTRLQLMGICIIGAVCGITVLQRNFDVAHAGFVGLAITYALTLTGSLEGVLNIFVETECKMVALERINEYTENVKSESHNVNIETTLPFAWPSQGVISFSNVFLKYREGTAYSLKDVTFETLAGEKIGIVGRTGAGKSSLLSCLFRLTHISGGCIRIDTIDISNIPLRKLRSKMTIIPQDPFIFTGTVRDNLDPYNDLRDFHIWETVTRYGFVPLVTKLGGLCGKIGTGGVHLSVGEKQLICLLRAILRNSKIVCIDEATANVDVETDERIQNDVMKNAFQGCTVLMIAHRVQSVMHCNRVLVMSEGEVLEFDSPKFLLQNSDSHFYKLVNQNLS